MQKVVRLITQDRFDAMEMLKYICRINLILVDYLKSYQRCHELLLLGNCNGDCSISIEWYAAGWMEQVIIPIYGAFAFYWL